MRFDKMGETGSKVWYNVVYEEDTFVAGDMLVTFKAIQAEAGGKKVGITNDVPKSTKADMRLSKYTEVTRQLSSMDIQFIGIVQDLFVLVEMVIQRMAESKGLPLKFFKSREAMMKAAETWLNS